MIQNVVDDPLALTLGSIYSAVPPPPPRAVRRRLNNSAPSQQLEPPSDGVGAAAAAEGSAVPAPPLPWATERPARHDTLEILLSRGVTTVEGEARCKRCNCKATMAYDLAAKFQEVRDYVAAHRHEFNDRAPEAWMNPTLPDCATCGEKRCVSPVIPDDKDEINWLFLLLGQLLGCCTLEQLKYFCKNTGRHRTGAKNRVLYYAFLEMCKQLDPRGPFDDSVANGNGFLHA